VSLPVLVDDDGRSLDAVTARKLLPQVHAGVQVTALKVTLGLLRGHTKVTQTERCILTE